MFSTFPKFVNTVFLYMFHFTPAHIAEFISGIIGGLKDWLLDLPARMVSDAVQSIRDKLTGIVDSTPGNLDDWLLDLVTHGSTILQHLTSAGQYHAAAGFADPISLSDIASRFGLADAGADVQALVDKAVNGFGGASSGNTLADFLSKFTDVHAKAAAA